MTKAALLAFNGEATWFARVLLNALDMQEKGFEVRVIIDAEATGQVSLLVTEPTPFTLCDLKPAVDTMRKLDVRFGVVLNRADVGDDETGRYCPEKGTPILMRIPYDRAIAGACSRGGLIVKARPECVAGFRQLFEDVCAEASQ